MFRILLNGRLLRAFAAIALILSLSAGTSLPALAGGVAPRIRIDGVFVQFARGEQEPAIADGRTLVPLRAVMERMGFEISWDAPTSTARLRKEGYDIHIKIGSASMTVNGSEVALDVPARIMNGSTMVPLRAISEATGAETAWDGQNRIADIMTRPLRSAMTLPGRRLTEAELAEWVGEYRAHGGPSEFELEAVRYINIEREKRGLKPLAVEDGNMMSARYKSQEMIDVGYYAHISPVHGSASAIPALFGVYAAGENILNSSRSTPEEAVSRWMNSPGHRASILDADITTIGIGKVYHMITMHTA